MFSSKDKINDLSSSDLRKRFFESEFVPENNLAIASIRVSSKVQERGQSFTDQMETVSSYTEREHLSVQRVWKVAETASKHEERKHFHEMMDFVRASQITNRPIKHLIFPFQSRSNRNRYSARELEDLVDMGVVLHFARDGRKLTCKADISDWMMWHMENVRNEAYIHELTKNAMGGIIKCIERGVYPGCKPPFGYRPEGRKSHRHFVFDGDKAEYMKLAFEMVIENESAFSSRKYSDELLKKELDQKFPHIKNTPNKKHFCRLLRNPFYYGDFVYDDTVYKGNPEYHPPLVSKEMWDRVQDILEGRHRKRRLSKAHPYIGMMTCNGKIIDENGKLTEEKCGFAVTGEKIRKKYKNGTEQEFDYYRCSNPNKTRRCSQRDHAHMKQIIGRNVSYRQEEIEEIFQEIFKSFSFDELTCKRMKDWLWKEHFEEKRNSSEKLKQLQQRQYQLKEFIEKAYEDKLTGVISEEIWKANNQKWTSEHDRIVVEIGTLKDHTDEYMQRGVTLIELIQHAEIIYKQATPEKKRKLVELVSSNLLLADGNLEYHWKIPFNMLAIKGDFENWRRR